MTNNIDNFIEYPKKQKYNRKLYINTSEIPAMTMIYKIYESYVLGLSVRIR